MSGQQASKTPLAAWITLGLAAAVGFFTLFAILTVSPLLTPIIGELSLTFTEGGLLFSVLVAMIVVGALIGGYVGDRLGIKKAMGFGAVLVGVGAPLRGLATGYVSLLLFMALVGLGYGFLLPNLPKLAEGWFPPKYLGAVTGIYMASLYGGAAFAVSVTLPIYSLLASSWRNTLALSGFFSTLVAVVWWLVARDPPQTKVVNAAKSDRATGGDRFWANRQ